MKKLSVAMGVAALAAAMLPYPALAQTAGGGTMPAPGTTNPPIQMCPFESVALGQGASGDDVRALQSVLAQDTTIYPQGLVTGYLGALTQEAIKKVQARNGLPQTGVINDPQTRKLIFPCVSITVNTPNGGETWQTGQMYEITWSITAPYYQAITSGSGAGTTLQQNMAKSDTPVPSNAIYPFLRDVSIDLTESGRIVYHIGSASLYENGSMKWMIPSTLASASDYKVRIELAGKIPQASDCRFNCPAIPQLYPTIWQGYIWDESDMPFTITGGGTPPPPPPPTRPDLTEIRRQISAIIVQLQAVLVSIDKIAAGSQ